jgi:hypothetical protein
MKNLENFVTKKSGSVSSRLRGILLRSSVLMGLATVIVISTDMPAVRAATLYNNGTVTISLESTLSWTLGVRVAPTNSQLLASSNNDDGDRNFRHGVMENRGDILEQLDIADGNYGFHGSFAAWLDTVYLQHNQNNSPSTYNNSGPNNSFTSATVNREGRRFEPLTAYIFGSKYFDNGNQNFTWRIGRQTVLWGDSLYFGKDAIAGGQAPIDLYRAQAVADLQAQDLFLPTGSIYASYDINPHLTIQAYDNFEYEADQYPGVGSYFQFTDFLAPGGQRILLGPVGNGELSIYHGRDQTPHNGFGQFGVALRSHVGTVDIGAYYIRFDDKSAQVYDFTNKNDIPTPAKGGLSFGTYSLVYPQNINAFGISASGLVLDANVAGEISGRTNMDLYSGPGITVPYGEEANTTNHPRYAVGDVIDAQISTIYDTPALPLMPGGASIMAEAIWNKVLTVTQNKAALVPDRTAVGSAFQVVFTPTYYEVFPQTEIDLPIGLTSNIIGRSQYDASINAGTGLIDLGVKAIYRQTWILGTNYAHYYGTPTAVAAADNNPSGTNGEAFVDRDFVSIYVQHTF